MLQEGPGSGWEGQGDLGLTAALFLGGSLSAQTVDHLPLIIISKGKERGCVSWFPPFNNCFLSGDSSTMEEGLGRDLTQAARALPKQCRDSGAGPPPAGRSWQQG